MSSSNFFSVRKKKEDIGNCAAQKITANHGGLLVCLNNGAGPEGTTISISNWSTTLNSCEAYAVSFPECCKV
jgi:hypothetical protein